MASLSEHDKKNTEHNTGIRFRKNQDMVLWAQCHMHVVREVEEETQHHVFEICGT